LAGHRLDLGFDLAVGGDVAVRAALEVSGLDHGPISVHDKMRAMGLSPVPSTASLARIFREAGVAPREPNKKPRSAWRRFVYPGSERLLATRRYRVRPHVRDLPAHQQRNRQGRDRCPRQTP
jgi:hypothetical protein